MREPKYKIGDKLMHLGTSPDRIRLDVSGSFVMVVLSIMITRYIEEGGTMESVLYRCRVVQAWGEPPFSVKDFNEHELVPAPELGSANQEK